MLELATRTHQRGASEKAIIPTPLPFLCFRRFRESRLFRYAALSPCVAGITRPYLSHFVVPEGVEINLRLQEQAAELFKRKLVLSSGLELVLDIVEEFRFVLGFLHIEVEHQRNQRRGLDLFGARPILLVAY